MTSQSARTVRLIFTILGLIAGIGMIVFSFVVLDYGTDGYRGSSASFGGDFYTEIHSITRDAVLNLDIMLTLLGYGLFGFLLTLGIADIAYFGNKLADTLEQSVHVQQPVSYAQSPVPFPADAPQNGGQ